MRRGTAPLLALAAAALGAACGDGGTAPDGGTIGGPGGGTVTLAAELPIPPQYGLHDTYVRGGLAFLFAWNSGVYIYDVGNGMRGGSPASPKLVSQLVTSSQGSLGGPNVHNGWWFHNPVTGEQRYLFIGQEGPTTGIGGAASGDIHVVDVSDLANPKEVGFVHIEGAGVHNFWMDEPAQILYAAWYNAGVVAIDVSGTLSGDLSNRILARLQPGGAGGTFTWGVQLVESGPGAGSLYASDMLSGFYQLRYAAGAFTKLAGGGNVPARFSSDLWVQNGYAYTGTWGNRGVKGAVVPGNVLYVWKLDASGAPALADSVTFEGIGTVSDDEVSADGKYLLVTTERGTDAAEGLYLYSLANPVKPVRIAFVPVPGGGNNGSGGLHTGTFATIGGRRYVFAARNPGAAGGPGPSSMIFDVTGVAP
ncbi:MAG TPA: hypothetical protein VFS40_12405 [Gemmatimonadales bacterium]|nr:hypothetical protein [Gemmatimonadales bacterium]